MDDTRHTLGDDLFQLSEERAQLHLALASTLARGAAAITELRTHRARHVAEADSLAVERRILREDFAHRSAANACRPRAR